MSWYTREQPKNTRISCVSYLANALSLAYTAIEGKRENNNQQQKQRPQPSSEARRTEHWAPGLVDHVQANGARHLIHVRVEHAVLEPDRGRLERVLLRQRNVHFPDASRVRSCDRERASSPRV